jgi:hypothetical protein
MNVELFQDIVDVILHRGKSDAQVLRNLVVGKALIDEPNDLEFS